MANSISIDPRLLLPWTTGTNFRVVINTGLVNEVGSNKLPSPLTSSTIATFASGPYVASSFPASGTTSELSTATITYNRPLFDNGVHNYYLYKETPAGDELIATIPTTSTRVTRIGKKDVRLNFRDLLKPNFTYYLTADAGVYKDLFSFPTTAINTSTVFRYTPGPAAGVINVTPGPNIDNQYVNNVTIEYNRDISVLGGNYYLTREGGGIVKTIPITSSSVAITTSTGAGGVVGITFDDVVLPEGNYYFTSDEALFRDQYNFDFPAITNPTVISWHNTALSNMTTRRYRGDSPYGLFTATTPQVLDIDLDSNISYTLRLESPIGEFSSSNGGTDAGSYWTFTGTKSQVNSIVSSIVFTSYSLSNPPSTYTYTLSKNGVVLVSKTKDLLGILLLLGAPGPTNKALPRLNLTVSGQTVVDESITVVAKISTSTQLAGGLLFKDGTSTFTSSTISISGDASTSVSFSTTGTKFINASWLAGLLPDGYLYEPLDSYDTPIVITERANWPHSLDVSVNGIPSLQIPVGPSVDLTGDLGSVGFTADGTITFKKVTVTNTTTSYTSSTTITIAEAGVNAAKTGNVGQYYYNGNFLWPNGDNYWIKVDTASTISAGDWLKISGVMTGVGLISSVYQVNRVDGTYIILGARAEDTNTYYWYDTLKEFKTPGITVALNTINYNGSYTKADLFRLTETAIGTGTVVSNQTSLTTSFNEKGTFYIVGDWSGRDSTPKFYPLSSNFIQITVDDRAQYDADLTLISSKVPVHQLSTATLTLTGGISTATTGTLTLVELVDGNEYTISVGAFTGTNVAKFVLNPNSFIGTGTSHQLKINWDGQEWVPTIYFPYYGKSSNTLTQTVNLATLSATASSATNIQTLPNTFTAIANTSSASAGTVSWYNNDALILTTATNNNSSTITLSSGTLTVGQHNIKAVWNNTNPRVESNSINQNILAYLTATIDTTVSTSSYILFNQDNTPNTATITALVNLSGAYPTHAPTGKVRLIDNVITVTSGTVTASTGTTSSISLVWNPYTVGQTKGSHTLSFNYDADDWNGTATISKSLSIVKPTASLALAITSDRNFYLGRNLNVKITKPTNTTLNNNVQLKDELTGQVVSSGTFVNNTASLTIVPSSTALSRNYIAIYDEDTYHELSTSSRVAVSLTREIPTITFTMTSVNNFYAFGDITYTANVANNINLLNPISFVNQAHNTTVGTATIVSGVATLTIPYTTDLGAGTFVASYAGDTFNNAGASSTISRTIRKVPTTATLTATVVNPYVKTWPNGQTGPVVVQGDQINLTVNTSANTQLTNIARSFNTLANGSTVQTGALSFASYSTTSTSTVYTVGSISVGVENISAYSNELTYFDSIQTNSIPVYKANLENSTQNWNQLSDTTYELTDTQFNNTTTVYQIYANGQLYTGLGATEFYIWGYIREPYGIEDLGGSYDIYRASYAPFIVKKDLSALTADQIANWISLSTATVHMVSGSNSFIIKPATSTVYQSYSLYGKVVTPFLGWTVPRVANGYVYTPNPAIYVKSGLKYQKTSVQRFGKGGINTVGGATSGQSYADKRIVLRNRTNYLTKAYPSTINLAGTNLWGLNDATVYLSNNRGVTATVTISNTSKPVYLSSTATYANIFDLGNTSTALTVTMSLANDKINNNVSTTYTLPTDIVWLDSKWDDFTDILVTEDPSIVTSTNAIITKELSAGASYFYSLTTNAGVSGYGGQFSYDRLGPNSNTARGGIFLLSNGNRLGYSSGSYFGTNIDKNLPTSKFWGAPAYQGYATEMSGYDTTGTGIIKVMNPTRTGSNTYFTNSGTLSINIQSLSAGSKIGVILLRKQNLGDNVSTNGEPLDISVVPVQSLQDDLITDTTASIAKYVLGPGVNTINWYDTNIVFGDLPQTYTPPNFTPAYHYNYFVCFVDLATFPKAQSLGIVSVPNTDATEYRPVTVSYCDIKLTVTSQNQY